MQERKEALAAVITGDLTGLPVGRTSFRAYSYMSGDIDPDADVQCIKCTWPPVFVANCEVLGKNYPTLFDLLNNPTISEPKAFEALMELAVLVRLLSEQRHSLVPHHKGVPDDGSFEAMEMYHVDAVCTNLSMILDAVTEKYEGWRNVLQVVVPLFDNFPVYDFFVFHRSGAGDWTVAAGYQRKKKREYPMDNPLPGVLLSVWLEGGCPKYRRPDNKGRRQRSMRDGWVVLDLGGQCEMLGESIANALPVACDDQVAEEAPHKFCGSERGEHTLDVSVSLCDGH